MQILLTGPESSGKTYLARHLAEQFDGIHLPEYAREYLEARNGTYSERDLLEIAQIQREREFESHARLKFVDTSMLVMKIWSEVEYGRTHPWIDEQWDLSTYDLILLCKPDIPWEPDPLRTAEKNRGHLYMMYREALEKSKKNFVVISGNFELRKELAETHVRMIIRDNQKKN